MEAELSAIVEESDVRSTESSAHPSISISGSRHSDRGLDSEAESEIDMSKHQANAERRAAYCMYATKYNSIVEAIKSAMNRIHAADAEGTSLEGLRFLEKSLDDMEARVGLLHSAWREHIQLIKEPTLLLKTTTKGQKDIKEVSAAIARL